jgi:hypothetical protein
MKLEFLDRFSKNTQISDFMKILPVGAKFSLRTDGQTNRQMTKVVVAFSNFVNAPKKTRGVAGSCAFGS